MGGPQQPSHKKRSEAERYAAKRAISQDPNETILDVQNCSRRFQANASAASHTGAGLLRDPERESLRYKLRYYRLTNRGKNVSICKKLTIDANALHSARELGINVSAVAEAALLKAISESRHQR